MQSIDDLPSSGSLWYRTLVAKIAMAAIIATLILLPAFYIWFVVRIEPTADQIAIVLRKTGEDLPSGQILALDPKQKGIQLEVLSEGRYFRNPYTWGWRIHHNTDIPAGQLGVVTRLYGKPMSAGKILADKGYKGIMAEVLRPGKYRINPYAYNVQLFTATSIPPGAVGVVTSLVNKDVLNSVLPPKQRNTFLVGENLKGVTPKVLDPGTYYLNPYLVNVVEVNLQSQRFQMSGLDAINFLTLDGFEVSIEGTIEFGLLRDKVALLTHRVGNMEAVLRKVILPRARGFSRIEGSKHPATNFIVGQTRQQFQNNLETHLRDKSEPWGVAIHSVLIRNIRPPDQIASIIRKREVAVQDARKYKQQIRQAHSEAELVRQEMLAEQNKAKVKAETNHIRALIEAEQKREVQQIIALKNLEVATINNEAADFQAQAAVAKAQAEADVIRVHNQAEAAVLKDQVSTFGNGMALARHTLYQRMAPRIVSLLSSESEQGLGSLFNRFLPQQVEIEP